MVYGIDHTGAIVFRTDVGTKLAHITRGAVSFEADGFDVSTRTGWSVLVNGIAHEIGADDATVGSLEAWLPTPLRHAVRIVPSSITGRRISDDSYAVTL